MTDVSALVVHLLIALSVSLCLDYFRNILRLGDLGSRLVHDADAPDTGCSSPLGRRITLTGQDVSEQDIEHDPLATSGMRSSLMYQA